MYNGHPAAEPENDPKTALSEAKSIGIKVLLILGMIVSIFSWNQHRVTICEYLHIPPPVRIMQPCENPVPVRVKHFRRSVDNFVCDTGVIPRFLQHRGYISSVAYARKLPFDIPDFPLLPARLSIDDLTKYIVKRLDGRKLPGAVVLWIPFSGAELLDLGSGIY
jgi:hypothetical protein